MEIQHSTKDGCQVVTLRQHRPVQRLPDPAGAGEGPQRGTLRADLRPGRGRHPGPGVRDVFASVANHPSSRWPATGFLLCGGPAAGGRGLGRAHGAALPELYASLRDALDAAVARPPNLLEELVLAPIRPGHRRPAFSGRSWATGGSACPTPWLVDGRCWWPSELVTNAILHAPHRAGAAGGAARGTCSTWRSVTAARSCCAWSPTPSPIRKRRVGVGCGSLSSSPAPGGSTATPTAARSSGAPSTWEDSTVEPMTARDRLCYAGPRWQWLTT